MDKSDIGYAGNKSKCNLMVVCLGFLTTQVKILLGLITNELGVLLDLRLDVFQKRQ